MHLKCHVGRRYKRTRAATILIVWGALVILSAWRFVHLPSTADPSFGYPVRLLSFHSDDRHGHVRPQEVKLLTYNIRWGLGTDNRFDLERIIATLRAADADIAVINEVDVHWPRSGYIDQPVHLAAGAGYPYAAFVPSLQQRALPGRPPSYYGNLILSRYPIVRVQAVRLPVAPWREERSLIIAGVDIAGRHLTVMGTHLGLSARERMAQIDRLLQVASDYGPPVVILGDFNALPASPEIARLKNHPLGFGDAFAIAGVGPGNTFPYPQPYARIDYIFVSTDLQSRLVSTRTRHVAGSDHLPVVATLQW